MKLYFHNETEASTKQPGSHLALPMKASMVFVVFIDSNKTY